MAKVVANVDDDVKRRASALYRGDGAEPEFGGQHVPQAVHP